MKTRIIAAIVLLCSTNVMAGYSGVYGYSYHIPILISDYQKELLNPSPLEMAGKSANNQICTGVFSKAVAKRSLDIRYALGYFDHSEGGDVIWDNKNWGPSPSLDGEIFFAMREALMRPCEGSRMFCGFSESGDPEMGKSVYSKTINLLGSAVDVNLTLTHASASYDYKQNLTTLKDRQTFLTAQAEENFFGGLTKADVVFYNGHSRNGGGPDFNPPVLLADGHPNYDGYYKAKRPGIKRVLEIIKKNPNQGLLYGSFSCLSASHFQAALVKANPNLRMILSSDIVDYYQVLKVSIGYLEGLMQGRCGEDLAQFAKRGDLYKEFKGINIR